MVSPQKIKPKINCVRSQCSSRISALSLLCSKELVTVSFSYPRVVFNLARFSLSLACVFDFSFVRSLFRGSMSI